MTAPAHVPVRRVLERVSAVPGAQPLRIFPLLLPLWRVEVRTTFWDAQPYEVFDQYLARAIGQAGLRDSSRLAVFFGVEPALVHRALHFLQTIGHVRHEGSALVLTDLGQRSVRDGCRYVRKEDRQVLYFDGFRGAPLPATHYAKSVWLDDPELTIWNVRFQVVTGSPNFRMEGLAELSRRPDGERFNLPGSLTELTPLEVGTAWLPAYVVECVSGLLVYIKALDAADPYLAEVATPYLKPVLEFPPFRRSGGYLLPVGAGVRLSGSVWVCQAVSYSSGLR
ncbi:hypothetical protein [Actinoplanes sp. NBRC 103695]|uniref:hypothetical protein n=1 Tax=Actinoplanes sp. NBRC 103695 TaxID=3032202 RepID=UPI0024A3FBD4|nr:hypothetical protein [Actinoplanes sp. NBRC 103695]GLZ01951.1 hypothetical protein Acsp02_92020 [Actinoplanes sp. NBRC 103695]